MTAERAETLMTAEELMLLPETDCFYELDEGRLVEIMPSGSESSIVSARVSGFMTVFVFQHDLGVCGDSSWGMKLRSNPDTVRAPDASFVRKDRIPSSGVPKTFWLGAPDLAVEVLSPTNSVPETLRKISDYLLTGTSLVWVIDPARRTATVYRADGSLLHLLADGVLDGEDVLPGFTLPLAQLWV